MFDHYILSSLVEEIRENLLGLRLQKIWSVNQSSFLLKFTSRAFLLIDLSTQKSHGRLLSQKCETQDLPQPFLLALRKTLEGAKLTGVSQEEKDRTLVLEFQGRTSTLDRATYRFYIEFMGRHTNGIITSGEDKILYAYKATPFDAKTDHIIRKDRTFTPLSASKKDPRGSLSPSDDLMDYRGFYKKLIKLLPEEVLGKNVGEIDRWIEESRDFRIFLDDNGDLRDFHQFNNPFLRSLSYQSLSSMLESFYSSSPGKSKNISRIRKVLDKRLELVEEKIEKLEKNLVSTNKADDYKLWGELLIANLHSLKSKVDQVELLNYYEDKKEIIELDDRKSPLENAQGFYKSYEKLIRSRPAIKVQLEKARKEKFSLEQALYNLEQVETPSDLEEVYQELERLKLLQKRKRASLAPSKARIFEFMGYRDRKSVV